MFPKAYAIAFLGAVFLLGVVKPAMPEQADLSNLVQQIAAEEEKLTDVDITFVMEVFDVDQDGQLVSTPWNKRIRYAFRLPFGTAVYTHNEGTAPWSDGAADYAYVDAETAFNGIETRSIWYGGIDEEAARAIGPQGNISSGLGTALGAESLGVALPLRDGKSLSSFLAACPHAAVRPSEGESSLRAVEVYTDISSISELPEGAVPQRIIFDADKGMAIVGVEYPTGIEAFPLNGKLEVVSHQEVAPGIWLPTETWQWMYKYSGPFEAMHCVVESVEVNRGLPDDLFTLEFEPNTSVMNLDTKEVVLVGYDEAEMDQAMEGYVASARNIAGQPAPASNRAGLSDPEADQLGRIRVGALGFLALCSSLATFVATRRSGSRIIPSMGIGLSMILVACAAASWFLL